MDSWLDFGEGNLDTNLEWRKYVDETISCFIATLPSELSGQLDYSLHSLSMAEEWMLERYPHREDTPDDDDNCIFKGLVLYVGETFRKHLGGYWRIGLTEVGKGPIIDGFYKDWDICIEDDVLEAIHDQIDVWLQQKLEAILELIAREK